MYGTKEELEEAEDFFPFTYITIAEFLWEKNWYESEINLYNIQCLVNCFDKEI